MNPDKFYLITYESGDKALLNKYSNYGTYNVKEIENEVFKSGLKVLNTNRTGSKASITVSVLNHPSGEQFTAEVGLGSIKDILIHCSTNEGIIKGTFKFVKRGKNYFIGVAKK